ncbi:MAG: response regulator [Bacteriovoracaceae bacterium]|nr:response regulator [Bacteriovoracaceae bacterium]
MNQKVTLSPTLKILIVDDMPSLRKMMRTALASMGFKNVLEAGDGNQAWDVIKAEAQANEPFELIISDINMPKCNGITLLKMIRANETFKDVPVLMVSTESEKDIIMTAIEEGASNYIIKPFSKEVVKEKLLAIFYK